MFYKPFNAPHPMAIPLKMEQIYILREKQNELDRRDLHPNVKNFFRAMANKLAATNCQISLLCPIVKVLRIRKIEFDYRQRICKMLIVKLPISLL